MATRRKRDHSVQASVVQAYRRKHRTWQMEAMPGMPERHWARYLHWVFSFGGKDSDEKVKATVTKAVGATPHYMHPTLSAHRLFHSTFVDINLNREVDNGSTDI